MDPLAAFQFTLSSPATHIFHCLSAFLSYLFSLGTDEARLQHIRIYVSRILQEISQNNTDGRLLQKAMIYDGIQALLAIAKSIKREVEARSRQFVFPANQEFKMVSYSAVSKRIETSLCTYRLDTNLVVGQAQMFMECRGSDLFQHNMSYGNQIQQIGGRSEIFLRPLGLDAQLKPMLININDITFVQGNTDENYARGAKPQRNIRTPQRILWTRDRQIKFKNAVEMLGGHNLATGTQIWRMLKDENLTVRHVQSYLQRYRNKQRKIGK